MDADDAGPKLSWAEQLNGTAWNLFPITMKLGIILYSNDPETVSQTFKLGTVALKKGDEVSLFMLAKGVECDTLDNEKWHISEQMRDFQDNGGKALSCSSCLELRQRNEAEGCTRSSVEGLYRMIHESDLVLTF